MEIKIIKAKDWNWYKDKIGEIYTVKDLYKYEDIGVQVYRNDDDRADVVEHGHFEYV